ncbi:MAG TPA: TonB-dependent receptor [Burkholderiaceae bacterium]|jgi:outer membrane receptor protein involved in Fe transport|nr:TonB-dependent receptor [Burkholderiaceae bacterium]
MLLLRWVCASATIGLLALPGQAQQPAAPGESRLDVVEVTSTRLSAPVQESPDSITVVSGEDLRARGATDLRSALALVGGISVYSGGDSGPASSTPSVLGRTEADDFLLLIDGVPVGGAFIPAFATLDLHDVERIEVVRASAPVFYGTTAFAGTIHVIHYAAGQADRAVHASVGSFGSASADAAAVLSQGPILQSLSADAGRTRVAGDGIGSDRVHGLYRLAADTGFARAHLDVDATAQWQKPQSPVPIDANGLPTSRLPVDFNQNPSDARIDSDVARLVAGLDGKTGAAAWGTTVSFTRNWTHTIEGFFDNFPDNSGVGFRQGRQINELFADFHGTRTLWPSVDATVGLNELLGRAQQDSTTFDYTIPTDGGAAPAGASLPGNGGAALLAHRSLFGLYMQTRWKPVSDVSLLAGVRYNITQQHIQASERGATADQSDHAHRASGSFGGSWRFWSDTSGDLDDVSVHASYSNTFQLAQLDFGPTSGFAPLIKPETQRGFTAGIKADGLDGRFDADLDVFYSDFGHQPLNGSINGLPALVAAGSTRYRGVELETSIVLTPGLRVAATLSLDDARYRDFNDASQGQLAGNRIALTPRWRSALGLTYAPARGLQVAANLNGEGSRFLDNANLHPARAYGVFDALIGYRWSQLQLSLNGTNLTDRREPILPSDLGDGQVYLLPRRHIDLSIAWSR